jgi:mono/diheme cytochrome c family protein
MASRSRVVHVAGSIFVAWVMIAGLAAQTPSGQKPKIKTVAAVPIQSVEGVDNFMAYCAVCHGQDAKGNGPAAPAMKVPVPDLTMIAQRHDGKFNAIQIEHVIRGTEKTATPAHGSEDMPIWGAVFAGEDRAKSTLRIGNLVKYLQSIQGRM